MHPASCKRQWPGTRNASQAWKQRSSARSRNAVNSVADWPFPGTPIDDLKSGIEVRRLSVGRFPYSLIHIVDTELVVVLAVAHQRRRPRYWVDRVDGA